LQLAVENTVPISGEGVDNFAMWGRYVHAPVMYKRGASKDYLNSYDREDGSATFKLLNHYFRLFF
jgi:hypothetical protein